MDNNYTTSVKFRCEQTYRCAAIVPQDLPYTTAIIYIVPHLATVTHQDSLQTNTVIN